MKTIHAVFEGGMFRPLEAVELPEKCEVEFEPRPLNRSEGSDENLSAVYAILAERYVSQSPAEQAKAFHEWAEAHRKDIPLLSDEAVSRKSFYE